MRQQTDKELYENAVRSILNAARDEMITLTHTPETRPNRETESKLQALKRKLGI